MLVGMWERQNSYSVLVELQSGWATMEISVEHSEKTKSSYINGPKYSGASWHVYETLVMLK